MRTSRPEEAELSSHKMRVKPEDKSQRVTLFLGADTAHVEHQVSGRGQGPWGLLGAAAKEQLKYTQLLFPEIKWFSVLVCRPRNFSKTKKPSVAGKAVCSCACLPCLGTFPGALGMIYTLGCPHTGGLVSGTVWWISASLQQTLAAGGPR